MKKSLYNILFLTTLIVIAGTVLSCKADVPEEPPIIYNGLTKEEAMRAVGSIEKTYIAKQKQQTSSARFVNGQTFPNYLGSGVTAVFDSELVEYNTVDENILKYLDSLYKDKPRKNWPRSIHQTYDISQYVKGKEYIEFSTYTDTENGKVIAYDLNYFDGNFTDSASDWRSKHIHLSPDLKEDIDRRVNIKTGERTEQYHYAYSKRR